MWVVKVQVVRSKALIIISVRYRRAISMLDDSDDDKGGSYR
jgi:hypothetical protein